MSEKSDGGSAFPTADGSWRGGMTLRDWFAGLAMQQMCAGPGARMVADRDGRFDETNWKEIVASNAYDFADAMIEARKK